MLSPLSLDDVTHSEMNNDIMIAPETAYIVGAFFSAYELPPNCAITVQDIPRTEALETIREGCTKQEERFIVHIRSQDELVQKIGHVDHASCKTAGILRHVGDGGIGCGAGGGAVSGHRRDGKELRAATPAAAAARNGDGNNAPL